MNFLKKKLKPITSSLTNTSTSKQDDKKKDLEDDLFDEYVIEAPPHPSELLALGIDPGEIDANDPEKLRELYKRAKAEGKDKTTNSILFAKQREKEQIEEKKKTREEWKFFESLTARVEQVVKESQKNIDQWKESSTIDKLTEPEYELKLTPEQVIKYSTPKIPDKIAKQQLDLAQLVKEKKSDLESDKQKQIPEAIHKQPANLFANSDSSCPKEPKVQNLIVDELLNDFGLDLRSSEQKKAQTIQEVETKSKKVVAKRSATPSESERLDINLKAAARPRPRPKSGVVEEVIQKKEEIEEDPFDTSFVTDIPPTIPQEQAKDPEPVSPIPQPSPDPFDTSYIQL